MPAYANPQPVSLRARLLRPLIRMTIGRAMSSPMPHVKQRRALIKSAASMKLFHARGGRITAQTTAGVPGLLVTPTGAASGCVLIYFHGGGYAVGAPELYTSMANRIARLTGAHVLLPAYRLAPEHPFPAGIDDALAVYRAVLDSGVPPARIAFGGDSAGGGLSLACALAARDAGLPQPAAIVAYSPWTDLTTSGDSIKNNVATELVLSPREAERFVTSYLGDRDRTQPLASPLFAEYHGIAPMLIQVSAHEILLDDSRRLAERATAAGVRAELQIWDGVWHVWQAMPVLLPEADAALASTAAFLKRSWQLS
jgi:monoterpene epsilon-lactone hydrolase